MSSVPFGSFASAASIFRPGRARARARDFAGSQAGHFYGAKIGQQKGFLYIELTGRVQTAHGWGDGKCEDESSKNSATRPTGEWKYPRDWSVPSNSSNPPTEYQFEQLPPVTQGQTAHKLSKQ